MKVPLYQTSSVYCAWIIDFRFISRNTKLRLIAFMMDFNNITSLWIAQAQIVIVLATCQIIDTLLFRGLRRSKSNEPRVYSIWTFIKRFSRCFTRILNNCFKYCVNIISQKISYDTIASKFPMIIGGKLTVCGGKALCHIATYAVKDIVILLQHISCVTVSHHMLFCC